MNEGDKVKVSGAPGYADFQAVVLMELGERIVVEYEWGGDREVTVVPVRCVALADG
ncbi:hypothetical protein [Streptomyces johnsoniae]|uniref:DUF1918 domain-containing protein n=1 Tax=Streptomyces johnsoniae TaxID=3075532 RepID=A0ABU2RZW0_9ACTN|nr:hypothetical protein [Streptomyces sp. DSM 41886]MDT0442298.1 hypothetical protein [Streptomyces sp. DSM 41886]